MKVVHAVRSDGFAGVERHVAILASAQAETGLDVTVIGGDPAAMVAHLPDTVEHHKAVTTWDVVRHLRKQKTDIVHAHMTAAEAAVLVADPLGRTPVVVTRHFARLRGAGASRLAAAVIRRRVGRQIAVSRYVATRIDGDSVVIHPGVPDDEGEHVARSRLVLAVQRLQPEKATDVAIRAFAAGAPDDWRMQVVGRGSERSRLELLAHELGVKDRVEFLGFRHDVAALMSSAGILVAPCPIEALGFSVLEAMSHGLPVVAANAGAHRETVGSVGDAHLFDPGRWQQAAVHLKTLAEDDSRRAAYGEALQQAQRREFTPQAQVRATMAVYEELL